MELKQIAHVLYSCSLTRLINLESKSFIHELIFAYIHTKRTQNKLLTFNRASIHIRLLNGGWVEQRLVVTVDECIHMCDIMGEV